MKINYKAAEQELLKWVQEAEKLHDPGICTVAEFLEIIGGPDLIDNILEAAGVNLGEYEYDPWSQHEVR